MNNTEGATDYISRLTAALQKDIGSIVISRSEKEREKLENCLAGLPAVSTKLKAVLDQVRILETQFYPSSVV